MNVSKNPSLWRRANNDKHEAILRPMNKSVDFYVILPAVSPEGDEGYWESHHVFNKPFPSINKAKQHLKDAGYLIRTHWN
jgi:hypothetical protein